MADNSSSHRNHHSQLPDAQELGDILAAEAQRAIPANKQEAHYPVFDVAIEWFRRFEISTDIFELNISAQDLSSQALIDQGKALIDTLVIKMMANTTTETDRQIYDDAYDYLSEDDELEPADLLFIFGSKTPIRIEKALELYREGLAPTIMISGGMPFYGADEVLPEADRYKQLAIEAGVPAEAIITENRSITIPDNVRSSLNLLEAQGRTFSSIVLVNSPYSQRRGWAHFKKYLPDSVQVIRVNANTIEKYQRDKWFANEDGIRMMANEFVKLKVAVSLNTA